MHYMMSRGQKRARREHDVGLLELTVTNARPPRANASGVKFPAAGQADPGATVRQDAPDARRKQHAIEAFRALRTRRRAASEADLAMDDMIDRRGRGSLRDAIQSALPEPPTPSTAR